MTSSATLPQHRPIAFLSRIRARSWEGQVTSPQASLSVLYTLVPQNSAQRTSHHPHTSRLSRLRWQHDGRCTSWIEWEQEIRTGLDVCFEQCMYVDLGALALVLCSCFFSAFVVWFLAVCCKCAERKNSFISTCCVGTPKPSRAGRLAGWR